MNEKRYMKEKEVAKLLGCHVQTLRGNRSRRRGIPFIRHGRSVLYDYDVIVKYMKASTVKTEKAR
ncbi:hypothetical protein ES702_07441 [subsurface metagenome]